MRDAPRIAAPGVAHDIPLMAWTAGTDAPVVAGSTNAFPVAIGHPMPYYPIGLSKQIVIYGIAIFLTVQTTGIPS